MDSLFPVIGAAITSTAAAVAAFIFARRLGLTAVQRTYAEESARLVNALKGRVDMLEAENARLRAEVAKLESENGDLRRRIIILEHEFAEIKMAERKPR